MPPFSPYRSDSVDFAAKRILRMLEREERQGRESRRQRASGRGFIQASAPAMTQDDATSHADRSHTADLAQNESNAQSDQGAESQTQTQTLTPGRYGLLDLFDDWSDDHGNEFYKRYVATKAAESEMIGSQLPGRVRGPADAYRHILWSAELTRRFGKQRAREILGLHEQEGQMEVQPDDELAMDNHNNEIGIAIGRFSKDWNDVIGAARTVVSGSTPEGSGAWTKGFDSSSTLAPYAARWLTQDRWETNPKLEPAGPSGRQPPYDKISTAQAGQEMPTDQTNWYTNPTRRHGPAWVEGYVSDGYQYPYGERQQAPGPEDETLKRAIGAYRHYLKIFPFIPNWLR